MPEDEFLDSESKDETAYLYKQFPEFSVCIGGKRKDIESQESWVRQAYEPIAQAYSIYLKYYGQVLLIETGLTYDLIQYVPKPHLQVVDSAPSKWGGSGFYYFLEEGGHPYEDVLKLKFKLCQFLLKVETEQYDAPALDLLGYCRGGHVLSLFKTQEEVDRYTEYFKKNYTKEDVEKFWKKPLAGSDFDSRSKESDLWRLALCRLVQNTLPKWRKQ